MNWTWNYSRKFQYEIKHEYFKFFSDELQMKIVKSWFQIAIIWILYNLSLFISLFICITLMMYKELNGEEKKQNDFWN